MSGHPTSNSVLKRMVKIPTDPRVYEFFNWYWHARWGR